MLQLARLVERSPCWSPTAHQAAHQYLLECNDMCPGKLGMRFCSIRDSTLSSLQLTCERHVRLTDAQGDVGLVQIERDASLTDTRAVKRDSGLLLSCTGRKLATHLYEQESTQQPPGV
jgi:hypothetical protein